MNESADGRLARMGLWIGGLAVVVLAAGGLVLLARMDRDQTPIDVPPMAEQTGEAVRAFVASEGFVDQPVDVRREYIRRAMEAGHFKPKPGEAGYEGFSDAEIKRLKRNIGAVRKDPWEGRMTRYFELAPAERTAYLDRLIDEMQAKKAAGERKKAARSAAGTGEVKKTGGGFTPEHFKGYIEKTDPALRAIQMEFKRAYLERMEQRGIHKP